MTKDEHQSFILKGMSCSGCESIIEKTLTGLPGIKKVRASFAKNILTITYDPNLINMKEIKSTLKKNGYILETKKGISKKAANQTEKHFSILQFSGIVIFLIALYLVISRTVGFQFIPQVTSSMGYGLLFVVGLLTSLHCIAMCGGINMSQCINSQSGSGVKKKIKPSLLYNMGRLTSYTLIGGIIGAIGSVVSFSGWARGIVAIISGLFMVLFGLSMTGLFPGINRIVPKMPRIFREKAGKVGAGKGPYVVGLLNGLMPCGPLQTMQIYALGTGSFLTGALSMFAFGLGTMPLMFGLGAFVTMLGSKFTKKMIKVSAVLVAVLGIVMLGRGLALSGVSLQIPERDSTIAEISAQSDVTVENGVQNVTSTLTNRGYPDIIVEKGVPVVWNLQADEGVLNGCNSTLVIPNYGIEVKLKPGDNIIEFIPADSGTITYTCWMGMITGQIQIQ